MKRLSQEDEKKPEIGFAEVMQLANMLLGVVQVIGEADLDKFKQMVDAYFERAEQSQMVIEFRLGFVRKKAKKK